MSINKSLQYRYLNNIKACIDIISNHSSLLLESYTNVSIDELITKKNFKLFERYIDLKINEGVLTVEEALQFFLFLDDNPPIENHSNLDFYKFHCQKPQLLLNELKFLRNLISEDIYKKLKFLNTKKEEQLLKETLVLIHNKLNPSFGNLIGKEIRYVNLTNPYGVIQSSTISENNDLIFLSLNNPKVLIAEQIIHEATHLKFNELIAKAEFENLFNFDFSWFSPFAGKVRTIEMIANGHLAYSSVKAFYEDFLLCPEIKKLSSFEIKDLEFIKNRIAKVDKLLDDSSEMIKSLFKDSESWKIFLSHFILPSNINEYNPTALGNLNFTRIEKAEIILGLNTNKISRITIPISSTEEIFQNLNLNNYLFSNGALLESNEERLEFFSNLSTPLESHLESMDDDATMVHCYVGKSHELLRKAVTLDKNDLAGELFQIPQCCQSHFNDKWDFVIKHYSGDFVKYLIDCVTMEHFQLRWEINPIAMYFDSGFTWHFPCSLYCESTKKLSLMRFKQLFEVDSILATSLKDGAMGNYTVHEDGNYGYITKTQSKLYTSSKTVNSTILKSLLFE